MMFGASCLCGTVTWRVTGPVPPMFHCHCSRCRKSHGTAFATYVSVPERSLGLFGTEAVVSWRPDPGTDDRAFCGICASVVPYGSGDTMFVPTGNFHSDPGARPALHMFVASRAPWYQIPDQLPRHDGFPPGMEGVAVPDRAPLDERGPPRGSCLCGATSFVLDGGPMKRRYCHCSRCRKAGSAAHAANLTTSYDGVRFTRGEEGLSRYKVPEARFFTQVFCPTCGSKMPKRDRGRGISVVPMGALDDDPVVRATGHIFVGSKAPWFEITDDLPQYLEYPPSA